MVLRGKPAGRARETIGWTWRELGRRRRRASAKVDFRLTTDAFDEKLSHGSFAKNQADKDKLPSGQ